MSRTSAPTRRRAPVEVAPRPQTLRLRWSISPDAAAAAGWPERDPMLEIGLPFRAPVRELDAWIVEGERRRAVPTGASAGAWVREGALWHLDLPGLVRVTLRHSPDGMHALYARTPLLAELGLSGGRYEFDRAWLVGA